MSWSVSAVGTAAEVRGQLSEQFKGPLAEHPAGLYDDRERETAGKISELLEQILSVFDPASRVSISANGHLGFSDWDAKTGAYQSVNITVTPQGGLL